MANELFKALAKKQGKEKSMSILKKMVSGGSMPTDVMELKKAKMGMGSMMDPELSMAKMGRSYEYGYGGMVRKKKKKSKKKK